MKCEPDEVSQPHQQGSMDMFEDVSQMMSMDTGEYGGNYGDQEFDNSTQTGQVLQGEKTIIYYTRISIEMFLFQTQTRFSVIFVSR